MLSSSGYSVHARRVVTGCAGCPPSSRANLHLPSFFPNCAPSPASNIGCDNRQTLNEVQEYLQAWRPNKAWRIRRHPLTLHRRRVLQIPASVDRSSRDGRAVDVCGRADWNAEHASAKPHRRRHESDQGPDGAVAIRNGDGFSRGNDGSAATPRARPPATDSRRSSDRCRAGCEADAVLHRNLYPSNPACRVMQLRPDRSPAGSRHCRPFVRRVRRFTTRRLRGCGRRRGTGRRRRKPR